MFIVPILAIYILFFSENIIENDVPTNPEYQELLNNIPDYDGENYVIINNYKPFFTEEEKTLSSFEYYSDLDELGRAGVAFAIIRSTPSETN